MLQHIWINDMGAVLKKKKNSLDCHENWLLERSAGISRFKHTYNYTIRNTLQVEGSIIEIIEKIYLVWFMHIQHMPNIRWSKKISPTIYFSCTMHKAAVQTQYSFGENFQLQINKSKLTSFNLPFSFLFRIIVTYWLVKLAL